MGYWIIANLIVVVHLAFVLFVVLGGWLALKRPGWAFVHLPAAFWGAMIEFRGGFCPLTPLENWFRRAAGESGYDVGFLEHYLLPLLYPVELDRRLQLTLGTLVIVVNLVLYGWLLVRRMRRRSADGSH